MGNKLMKYIFYKLMSNITLGLSQVILDKLNLFKNVTPKEFGVYLEGGALASVLAYELSLMGYRALDMGEFYKRTYEVISQGRCI